MSIRDSLEQILARYPHAREEGAFGQEGDLWRAFAALRAELRRLPAAQREPPLRLSSAGFSSWARVPWVALVDRREAGSVRQGVYAALLVRQDRSGAYLALTQGTAEPRRQLGRGIARATLRQRAADLRALCAPLAERGFRLDDLLDLRTDAEIGADFEAATVAYRLYEAGELPPEEAIRGDLEALLGVYRRYLGMRRAGTLSATAVAVREPRRPLERSPGRFEPARAVAALVEHIARRHFVFEPWQVAAYVAALRTKPFVILAGVTGTGKSRLPALVAEATGGEARLIPVRPDWTDSSDLLGYSDLQGAFRPGVLLEAARQALGRPDRHLVCVLDEMNLARVEQYFAEVLSRIEDRSPTPEGGFATAPLLHPTLHDAKWAAVPLPANLALVGTVNMDESAHGFSRKVLDRAFTLELSEVDLSAWEPPADDAGPPAPAAWPVSAWHPRAIRLGELRNLSNAEGSRIRETVAALGEVNRFLTRAQLQAGYRTRDEMALFVLHAAELAPAFVTRAGEPVDPLDLALHMKVLPRVAGGSGAVRGALLGLLGWAWSGRPFAAEADARALVDDWESAGRPGALPGARFPHTAARLCLMWERLLAEGFTSFWL